MQESPQNRLFIAAKRLFFAVMLMVLGALIYSMAKEIEKLPSDSTPNAKSTPATHNAANTHEVTAGFRISGRIAQMNVEEGAPVNKGDVLATLDKAPLEQALAAAKAQLQAAQAEYAQPVALPQTAFNDIEIARADVEAAEHAYEVAHNELEKRRKLQRPGQIDHVYEDDVQNEHEAQLTLEHRRRQLAQREAAAGVGTHDTRKAEIDVARANVAMAENNLAEAELKAPVSGTIVKRVVEPATTITPGAAVYVIAAESATPHP